jgi:hypothetical protein
MSRHSKESVEAMVSGFPALTKMPPMPTKRDLFDATNRALENSQKALRVLLDILGHAKLQGGISAGEEIIGDIQYAINALPALFEEAAERADLQARIEELEAEIIDSAVSVATVGRHWSLAHGFDLNDFADTLPTYGTKLYALKTPPASEAETEDLPTCPIT